MNDSTNRFTDRVDNYVRYRPSYPRDVIDTLANECGLSVAEQHSKLTILFCQRPFISQGSAASYEASSTSWASPAVKASIVA